MTWEEISKELFEEKTEKRFTCDNDYYKGLILKDNLTNEILEEDGCLGYYTACNKLNELYNENEQLKGILHFLRNDNAKDILNVLNTQQNEIVRLIEENEQLKKELDYIQNSITEHIKHQKTELGQKALKEIIADYNEWMLGHKELEE